VVSFPQVSLPKPCTHLSSTPYVLRAPPISFFLVTRIICGEGYRSVSYSLCNLLHSHITSFLLHPNIFLSTLFSNTLSLCSSLSVRDQVSHPYKTTGKIIILYILIFIFLIENWKTKDFVPNDSKHSLKSVCS
jgi:hypothetical protein